MPPLADLYRLQEVDRQRRDLEAELFRQDAIFPIKALTEQLNGITQSLTRIAADLKRVERERQQQESEMGVHQTKRKELERRLYDGTVTNMKEMDKAEKMIADSRQAESAAEEKALAALLQAEALEERQKQLRAELAAGQAHLAVQESEYAAAVGSIEAKLALLPEQRSAILPRIDARQLAQYESIRQKKNGIGVVLVEQQACSGCRVGIPLAIMGELKQGEKLICCDHCGRILYWRRE